MGDNPSEPVGGNTQPNGSSASGAAGAPTTGAPTTGSIGTPTGAASQPKSALASLHKAAAAVSSTAQPAQPGSGQPNQPGAATTAQPGATGASSNDPEDPDWSRIPENRRSAILKNHEKKVTEAIEAKIGWAKNVNPEHVQGAFGLAQRLSSNPVQFVADLIGEIRQNPQMAAELQQVLGVAGQPNVEPQPKAKEPFKFPAGRLTADDGKTRTYSEEQLQEILTGVTGQLKSEFEEMLSGRVAPIEEFRGNLEERENMIATIQEARQSTVQLMDEMRTLPHFTKENEPKILEYLMAIPADVKQRIGTVAALQQAYNMFLVKDILPGYDTRAEQKVREEQRRKATAGSGGNVSGQAPATPGQKPRNASELSEHLRKKFAAANT